MADPAADDHDADTIDGSKPEPVVSALGIPRKVGTYAVKRLIGSGAMGTVLLAVQESPRRVVALKMLKGGVASKSALRRFEFESQILARLRHSNIAQVYDAGTWSDGTSDSSVPYFAMEYVAGAKTVTAFARDKRLELRERLELFTKICDAVHHGHQKGVIHRDLKPGNILVDSAGEPKIIDFGVARATDSDMAVTTLQTDVGQLIGTIQYMSPEQCEADPHDLDTRSDVYALGVILYELLCEELPYDVARVAVYEAGRIIREQVPPKLSTINRTLGGDIETITLKAMAKDRDQRYQSASELAQDIHRYLRSEPIEARPPSVIYQVRMFARRHAGMFTAAALIGIVLVSATIISVIFAARTAIAEQNASDAKDQAIEQRDLALAAEAEAQAARLESEQQRDAALVAEALAEQHSYVLHVAAASAALADDAIGVVKRHLSRAPTRPRNWEWFYLSNLVDRSLATLAGHESPVNSVALHPDGRLAATATAGGEIWIWDVRAGTSVARMTGHEGAIYSARFSPDGTRLATGSADATVRIWDVASASELMTIHGHEGVVTSVAFDAAGDVVASASSDGTIRLFDARTGAPRDVVASLEAAIDCIALSADGVTVAAGSDDGVITLWTIETGEQLGQLHGHAGYVTSLAFTPDAARLVSGSSDRTLRIWNVVTGEHTVHPHDGYVTSVAIDPGGTRIASAAEDATLRLWDVESGHPRATLHGHDGSVTAVAFSGDGARVITGSEDGTARLWDARERQTLVAGSAGTATIAARGGRSCIFSPDSRTIATASSDHHVELVNALDGGVVTTLDATDTAVSAIAYTPDGRLLATAADDERVRLWDARTGRLLQAMPGHGRQVTSVAFTADGSRLASGSWDGTARIWDVVTRQTVVTLPLPDRSLNAVRFLGDGTTLLGAATDGTLHFWSVQTGAHRPASASHDGPIYGIDATADGARIASASADGTARLWSGEGVEQLVLRGHDGAVTSVAFSPDGSRLVTASSDTTIRIWAAQTGDQLAALRGGDRGVVSVAFSHDGTRIASLAVDGTLRVWDSAASRQRFNERPKGVD